MNEDFPLYDSIVKYFYKNYNLAYKFSGSLSGFFVKNDSDYLKYFENIFEIEPIFFEWKTYKFPVFIHEKENRLFTNDGKLSFDIYLNCFLFLSGWQEIECTKKDKHGRFPYEESLQYKYDFVETPVVNIYFELLYEVALKKGINIRRKTYSNPFILSHDIDQLRSAWFENIQYELSKFSFKSIYVISKNLIKKMLNFKDDYYLAMKKMLEIDKRNNINAISFLMPVKSHKDADFEIEDKKFKDIIEETCRKQTIGIHPGYNTYNNIAEYKRQIDKLEKTTNKKITKSRQHFLRYDVQITPYIQDELEILEDYTLGFAEHYGFRNGIANPFYLYKFKKQEAFSVKQVPLVFMDVSLMNYSLNKDFEKVESFLEKVKKDYNCNFSILFHNSVFTVNKYSGFKKFYLKIININY